MINTQSKSHIRSQYLKIRAQLSPSYIRDASTAICQRLSAASICDPTHHVAAYFPYPKEVDIRPFLAAIISRCALSLPVFNPEKNLYVWTQCHDLNTWYSPHPPNPNHGSASAFTSPHTETDMAHINPSTSKYKIPEPPTPSLRSYDSFDFILVPGIAFDRNGNRIGHGQGHFDRLLSPVTGPKIGVCFDAQLCPSFIPDSHDCQMDYIVTDSEFITCPL